MAAVALRTSLLAVLLVVATLPASAGGVGATRPSDAPSCADASDFCAAFPDDAVAASDWPYRTNLTVTGNVSAVEITEDELNASQLAGIFGGERIDGGVRVEVGRDGTIPAEFEYRSHGNYTFHVRAVGTDRTAEANLYLAVGEAPTVGFSQEFPTVEFGETASLGLAFDDAAVGNVTIEGQGFRLTARVRDADGDGETTLLVDSDALGNGTEAVAVAGTDRLLTANVSAANRTLPIGRYELHAGLDGRETGVGSLRVLGRTGTTSTEATARTTGVDTTAKETTPEATTREATTGTRSTEVTTTADLTRSVDASKKTEPGSQTEDREESTRDVPGFGVGGALVASALVLALARLGR